MTYLPTLTAALRHTFTTDQLRALHQDAANVEQAVTDTEPWDVLVAALRNAKTPNQDQSGACAPVLGSSRRAQEEPVDLAEGPDAAARRLAGELWRLGSGLAELGIPLDETVSVDAAPVTTALAVLAEARKEITRLTAERDEALQDYRDLADRNKQAERALLDERYEHKQTSAAEDEARERAEELGTALTIAHRALRALDATSAYGVRLDSRTRPGRLVVLGFTAEQAAKDTGVVLSQALADHVGARVDATLIEPAKLGDPPTVDVAQVLEETRTALAAAESDSDREDVIEELLQSWYLAWPETALTSPHQAIAGELVRLLQPGPVTLTIPADLWAGLADRIKAGHNPEQSIAHGTQATQGCPDGPHGPHLRTDVGPNDVLIRSACLGGQPEAPA